MALPFAYRAPAPPMFASGDTIRAGFMYEAA